MLGLNALGLTVVGQLLTAERAVVQCRIPIGFENLFCKACGAQGQARATVARRLAHVTAGWRPAQLLVRLRRLACTHCRRVWRQDTSALTQPRARLMRSAIERGLRTLALEHMSVSRVAVALGVSWHTANSAVLPRGEQILNETPNRFKRGVEVLSLDEHVWRHTRQGDKDVTVIIDLTPVRDRTRPARLLDVIESRSNKTLKTWPATRGAPGANRLTWWPWTASPGSRAPPARSSPRPRRSWIPFHVVSLAADKPDQCHHRIQRAITGRRGRASDPLHRARRTLLTGADLLTDTQAERLEALFADERHAAVQAV